MANKINVKLILELLDAGMSRNSIASTRHMSKNSVSQVMNVAKERNIHFSDVRNLDENDLYRMFFPEKHAIENMYQIPDYDYIQSKR